MLCVQKCNLNSLRIIVNLIETNMLFTDLYKPIILFFPGCAYTDEYFRRTKVFCSGFETIPLLKGRQC